MEKPQPLKILYICTHNRCRSILCEAMTNHIARGELLAYSAGSQPAGAVFPQSLAALARRGIDTRTLKSQSWDDFATLSPDVVITVCDSAANEACPAWFQKASTLQLHWPLSDPSKIAGQPHEVMYAFDKLVNQIERRIRSILQDLTLAKTRPQQLAAIGANLTKVSKTTLSPVI